LIIIIAKQKRKETKQTKMQNKDGRNYMTEFVSHFFTKCE